MSVADFHGCTPRQFRAIYAAWMAHEEQTERTRWHQVRWMGMCSLEPWMDRKGRQELSARLRFPWEAAEGEASAPPAPLTPEEREKRYRVAAQRYGLRLPGEK